MNLKTVIHIVPSVPSPSDDIGQYAMNLAFHLRQSHGIESQFIVCDPNFDGPSRLDGFVIRRLRLQNEASIWSSLSLLKDQLAIVLLHYSGNAYHKRGFPFWLYRGIDSWLAERTSESIDRKSKFSAIFHDLWVSSDRPWTMEFYRQKAQHWLIRRLHGCSQISVASTRRMQSELEVIEPNKTFWLPTPSNWPAIYRGERKGERARKLRVAIFRHKGSCSPAVRSHHNLLRTLEKKDLLAGVSLLGRALNTSKTAGQDLAFLNGCVSPERVEMQDDLSPADVSGVLGRADFLLSHHLGEAACKSSVIMGALAGHCPVVLRDGRNATPLRENEHFIASDDTPPSIERFQRICADGELDRIASAARLWYERNADWTVISEKYLEVFSSMSGSHITERFSPSRESPLPHPKATYQAPGLNA